MPQPQGLTLVAGRYTITYAATAIGVLESNGSTDPAIEMIPLAEPVNGTDLAGDADLDVLGRGSNAFLQVICKEYKAGSIAAAWPFGTWGRMVTTGVYWGANYAGAIVLTAVAGTTAATAPATITATYSVLAPNNPIRLLYGPTLRKIPIRWQLLPYTSGNDVHFTQT
jgi:hypothetical protein